MIITPIRFLVPPHYHRPVPTLPAPTPDDLFGPPAEPEAPAGPRPLADRLRPRTLEEVVGQDPRYIARRLVCFAVGDIGIADSQALAGWEAYGRRCSPEVALAFGRGSGVPGDRVEIRRAPNRLPRDASAGESDRQRFRTQQGTS
jgi:hypothetical protein